MQSSYHYLVRCGLPFLLLCLSFSAAQDGLGSQISDSFSQGVATIREGFRRMFDPITNAGRSMFGGASGGAARSLFSGIGGSSSRGIFDSVPLVGTCDRIAYQGVANCASNFRPSAVGSKGRCCAWRKYRACINGVRSGMRLAAQSQRCPAQSISKSSINRISDRLTGFPVSQCPSNSCSSGGSSSRRRN